MYRYLEESSRFFSHDTILYSNTRGEQIHINIQLIRFPGAQEILFLRVAQVISGQKICDLGTNQYPDLIRRDTQEKVELREHLIGGDTHSQHFRLVRVLPFRCIERTVPVIIDFGLSANQHIHNVHTCTERPFLRFNRSRVQKETERKEKQRGETTLYRTTFG